MTDGRKNNGGARKGAGRPTKAQEQKLIERLDNLIESDKPIIKLLELIDEGSVQAIKIYMEYRYGKPKETKEIKLDIEQPIFNIDDE